MLKQALGLRSLLQVIPLNGELIRGSHGRIPDRPEEWPVLLLSEPRLVPDEAVDATAVYRILLDHIFSG